MSEAISDPYVSYVVAVGTFDEGPPTPLDIEFYGHAAVFNLERDHPCFTRWLAMLKASEAERGTLIFTHSIPGMRIRSLEAANKLTGIVEEVFHGIEHNSVGFKMPEYAGIFFIPNDHPQRLDWLAMVHKSNNAKIKIEFGYDAYHRRVTVLGLAAE